MSVVVPVLRLLGRWLLAALIVVGFSLVPAPDADAAGQTRAEQHRAIPRSAPACQQEDSTGCVWDARHRGNHRGMSFYVSSEGKVYRLGHKRAHRMVRVWRVNHRQR